MKPEPLKNKIQTYICPLTGKKGWKFFEDREVKSAFMFFIDEIMKLNKDKKLNVHYRAGLLVSIDVLRNAFPDIISARNNSGAKG